MMGSLSQRRSCRVIPLSCLANMFKSHFVSDKRFMNFDCISWPHTAHPLSCIFFGDISSQQPVAISSCSFSEGGSGGILILGLLSFFISSARTTFSLWLFFRFLLFVFLSSLFF